MPRGVVSSLFSPLFFLSASDASEFTDLQQVEFNSGYSDASPPPTSPVPVEFTAECEFTSIEVFVFIVKRALHLQHPKNPTRTTKRRPPMERN